MSVVDDILERALIAVIDAPIEERIFEWAMAVSKGGIGVLGVPVTLPTVTEVVSDLADEAGLVVGVSDIRMPEQLSVAVAAGAELVLSPVADWAIIEQAKMRGLSVIAGAFTPSEVHTAFMAGADLVALHPVGVFPGGEEYFAKVLKSFPDKPLLVSGGVDVENAPTFLELGAKAAIVDTGVFPETNDPAAVEVITMRAAALTEVCADVAGTPMQTSFTELRAPSAFPPPEAPATNDAKPESDDRITTPPDAPPAPPAAAAPPAPPAAAAPPPPAATAPPAPPAAAAPPAPPAAAAPPPPAATAPPVPPATAPPATAPPVPPAATAPPSRPATDTNVTVPPDGGAPGQSAPLSPDDFGSDISSAIEDALNDDALNDELDIEFDIDTQ